ncbi:MAG: hypothetical protein OEZ47_16405, partial [Gammaproteobacteria bacterium]|nr:hypothetical protein [Gammaproteobacteria bacterium]
MIKLAVKRLALATLCLLLALQAQGASFDLNAAKKQYGDVAFQVVHVSEMNYENGPAIGVRFSVPVDARKPFTEYLSVSIHNGERVE